MVQHEQKDEIQLQHEIKYSELAATFQGPFQPHLFPYSRRGRATKSVTCPARLSNVLVGTYFYSSYGTSNIHSDTKSSDPPPPTCMSQRTGDRNFWWMKSISSTAASLDYEIRLNSWFEVSLYTEIFDKETLLSTLEMSFKDHGL